VIVPSDWLEYRRPGDRERIGWLRPHDDAWIPVDLLGRDIAEPLDLDDAESRLDALGLSHLAERWSLDRGAGTVEPVRIVEVSTERVVVTPDDFGSASAVIPGRNPQYWTLPWPAPEALRLRE
jgi:hypothetical protein